VQPQNQPLTVCHTVQVNIKLNVSTILVHRNIVKEDFIIARDRYLTIRISDKMLKEFEEALAKSEYSKSEIVRECIRKFIKKQKV